MIIRIVESSEDLKSFCEFENPELGIKVSDMGNIKDLGADFHIFAENDGKVEARSSLWVNSSLKTEGKNIGFIGNFSTQSKEAAFMILDFAKELMKKNGIQVMIGPLNGSTWNEYRFLTWLEGEPFFLEPHNPPEWPFFFREYSFEVLASYYSVLVEDINKKNKRLESLKKRKYYDNIEIRNLSRENFTEEIKDIYELSLKAFKNNFLYTEIPKEKFLQSYMKFKEMLDYRLVYLAYSKEKLAGFVFAYPDFNERKYKEKIETVILKTLAVDKEFQGIGLGYILADMVNESASGAGYSHVIQALIHENNVSRKMAESYGKIKSKYELYKLEVI